MANTAQARPPQPPSPRHHLLRCIAIALLTLIVLVGLAVLITWLIIKPKPFDYSVEDGSVHNFNLINNHLNATFDFVFRSHNPNRKISIYYDSIEVSVVYEDQTLAFNTIEPFYQPHRNVTRLGVTLVAQNVALSGHSSMDLWHEKASRKLGLEVHVKARIRFKVGSTKLKHRTLRLLCYPVVASLSSSKTYERTECDIDG